MTGVDTGADEADHSRHHDKLEENCIVQLVVARDQRAARTLM